MHELWESKHRGHKGDGEEPETEHGGGDSAADSDVTDLTTDEDQGAWEARFHDETPQDQCAGSSDNKIDWRLP